MTIRSKKPARSPQQKVKDAGDEYIAAGLAIRELFERLQMSSVDQGIVNRARFAAMEFGAASMTNQIRERSVGRAIAGRRKIGLVSKSRVAKSAVAFMHLSKGDAAYEIAKIVNLDAGTVKRYLSQIFPGEKWHP